MTTTPETSQDLAAEKITPPASADDFWSGFLVGSIILGTIGTITAIPLVRNHTPDIGVRFEDKSNTEWRVGTEIGFAKVSRDLGLFKKEVVEEACKRSVNNWFNGKETPEIVEIPVTPQVREEFRRRRPVPLGPGL